MKDYVVQVEVTVTARDEDEAAVRVWRKVRDCAAGPEDGVKQVVEAES